MTAILFVIGLVVVVLGFSVFFGAPYLPSRRSDVRALFEALPLTSGDVLLDLGSGDGVVLREARRYGARAIGVEIHPLFAGLSRVLSWRDRQVEIHTTNMWTMSFPGEVTLVYVFSVSRDGRKLRRMLEQETKRLRRPLRVVCYGSPLPGIEPVRVCGAHALYEFQPLHTS